MSAIAWDCTRQTMERWCVQLRGQQQAEIDMRYDSDEIAMGVIAQVMLGKDHEEAREVMVAGREQMEIAAYAFADPPLPGFR